jgi:alanine racemase
VIHRVRASINLNALSHNLRVARQYAGQRKLLAVIKANAYGHGLLPVAEALGEADAFAVTDINEAEELASIHDPASILILQGILDYTDIPRIAESGFQVVIHREEELLWLEQTLDSKSPRTPLTFWLKMNSGMGRLGIQPDRYVTVYQQLKAKPWCADIVAMTHLANANLPNSALNKEQVETFTRFSSEIDDCSSSIAASSALLAGFGEHSEWVRPGIMLYGSSPFPYSEASLRRENLCLQAVMSLQAKIIAIQHCRAGDNVGYCSQFTCPKDMPVGIVSIGYADGYPSNAPNGTPVMVNGIRTTSCGRVSMDMIAVDLSPVPDAELGSEVSLWGDALSLDEVAEHTGIISYNLCCSIAKRVERVYG